MSILQSIWNLLPSHDQIAEFNLAEKLGIGVTILFLMIVSMWLIHLLFEKASPRVRIAFIHVFAIPIILVLSSCSLPHYNQDPKLHPPLPAPVEEVDVEFKVDTIEGKPRVSLSWEDSQKLRVWLADIKRYTLENKIIMCYYRQDLNEERCKPKEK